MKNETIAALSTAPYKAAIGVIRVSGEEAQKIVGKIFSRDLSEVASSSVIHGNIVDGTETVDDVLLSVFRAPKSFTGEDVIEISCHGGVYNCSRILRLLIQNGARQAKNGEFTKRAFLNGKLDLLKAEAIIDLIDSETKAEARAAVNRMKGGLSDKINSVRGALIDISAQLLAYVDYPDEDIVDTSPELLRENITNAYDQIEKLIRSYDSGRLIREGVKTVIAGKPNVGKSMLMNRILGEDRCIVTSVAGTTRDVIEASAELGGVKLRLFDTAGVRDADDEVEKIGVEKTLGKISEAELILAVFDVSDEAVFDDEELLAAINASNAKKIAVFNKTDIVSADNITVENFDARVNISAKTGDGIEELEKAIAELFPMGSEGEESIMLSNVRQYECLVSAQREITHALDNIGITPDALLSDIERAVEALGEMTGKTVSEEIIDNIFSRFCVGK
ncbi:MAG: tRNA uridine-5-carboxymethylaminomethyl(34) synthesis GTPase MnmE [Ruminococcaceae bacterium]|nr:tRNA uridine-5-carboxymethylaminomethyl(34) synthesis GTPase MnmE [Oscillospiraceae bacterium]